MILTSVMEYAASPRRLYSVLSDFEALEQIARQYGAAITTQSPGDAQGQGRIWQMQITARGMSRKVTARVANVVPPGSFQVIGESDGVMADLRVSIAPGVEKASRATFTATLSARGLGAKLLLQPLRLAHGSLEAKFHDRVVSLTRARLKAARQGGGHPDT